jgi:RHS repeat-associated protein
VCGFPKRAPITVVASYSYDPYGNTTSINETGLGVPNIVRYAGGLTDLSTGLTKYGQRYYDPAIGAFTQQDANQIPLASRAPVWAYQAQKPRSAARQYMGRPSSTGQGDILAAMNDIVRTHSSMAPLRHVPHRHRPHRHGRPAIPWSKAESLSW